MMRRGASSSPPQYVPSAHLLARYKAQLCATLMTCCCRDYSYLCPNLREMCNAAIFNSKVTKNRVIPRANADSVLTESNSLSPVSNITICTVTVVTASSGLIVKLAATPAAITTIIVSPTARLIANRNAPTRPGKAAGNTTRIIVSA